MWFFPYLLHTKVALHIFPKSEQRSPNHDMTRTFLLKDFCVFQIGNEGIFQAESFEPFMLLLGDSAVTSPLKVELGLLL